MTDDTVVTVTLILLAILTLSLYWILRERKPKSDWDYHVSTERTAKIKTWQEQLREEMKQQGLRRVK